MNNIWVSVIMSDMKIHMYGAKDEEHLNRIVNKEHMKRHVNSFVYYGERITSCESLEDVFIFVRNKRDCRVNLDADVIDDQITIDDYLNQIAL